MRATVQRGNKMVRRDLVPQQIIDPSEVSPWNCQETSHECSNRQQLRTNRPQDIPRDLRRVGERRQQNLRPEAEPSQPLRQLIDQLHRRDGELPEGPLEPLRF